MEAFLSLLASVLLLLGAVLGLIGAIGVVRLPDSYTRMHSASKAGALGAALILTGVAAFTCWTVIPFGGEVEMFGVTTRLQLTDTPVAAFFDRFSDDWMRRQPSASTGSRYFDGPLQSEMDRQLTPQTAEFRRGTLGEVQ